MKQETITNKLLTRNLWSVVFGSLSIRTDGKYLSETKTDDEQICFGFLCYFTSIK